MIDDSMKAEEESQKIVMKRMEGRAVERALFDDGDQSPLQGREGEKMFELIQVSLLHPG